MVMPLSNLTKAASTNLGKMSKEENSCDILLGICSVVTKSMQELIIILVVILLLLIIVKRK